MPVDVCVSTRFDPLCARAVRACCTTGTPAHNGAAGIGLAAPPAPEGPAARC